MPTSDSVWINEYTTGEGVHVNGHWRARHTPDSTTAQSADAGTQTPVTDAASAQGTPANAVATPSASTMVGTATSAPAVMSQDERISAGLAELRRMHHDQVAGPISDTGGTSHTEGTDESADPDDQSQRCQSCGQYIGDSDHHCPDGQTLATPDGMPAAAYGDLTADERAKAMVGDLETSVKAIMESGQLDSWLDAMASNGLARWSANNRILAIAQMLHRDRDASNLHLMGFRQWEKYDRKVAKGAKAVYILAPVTKKYVEEHDDGTTTEQRRVVAFKGVPVFDISDTGGPPLPELPAKPASGQATPGTLSGLAQRVTTAGYTYHETQIPGCQPETGKGTFGYTDPANKHIVVDARLSDAQKSSTIAHELAHVHCGHVDGDYSQYQRHRGRYETEAEMTAYLVNRTRGMSRAQAESRSPAYIAAWSAGDPKVMRAAMDTAITASTKILDGTWPDN